MEYLQEIGGDLNSWNRRNNQKRVITFFFGRHRRRDRRRLQMELERERIGEEDVFIVGAGRFVVVGGHVLSPDIMARIDGVWFIGEHVVGGERGMVGEAMDHLANEIFGEEPWLLNAIGTGSELDVADEDVLGMFPFQIGGIQETVKATNTCFQVFDGAGIQMVGMIHHIEMELECRGRRNRSLLLLFLLLLFFLLLFLFLFLFLFFLFLFLFLLLFGIGGTEEVGQRRLGEEVHLQVFLHTTSFTGAEKVILFREALLTLRTVASQTGDDEVGRTADGTECHGDGNDGENARDFSEEDGHDCVCGIRSGANGQVTSLTFVAGSCFSNGHRYSQFL
jgi:hypothetical protein